MRVGEQQEESLSGDSMWRMERGGVSLREMWTPSTTTPSRPPLDYNNQHAPGRSFPPPPFLLRCSRGNLQDHFCLQDASAGRNFMSIEDKELCFGRHFTYWPRSCFLTFLSCLFWDRILPSPWPGISYQRFFFFLLLCLWRFAVRMDTCVPDV